MLINLTIMSNTHRFAPFIMIDDDDEVNWKGTTNMNIRRRLEFGRSKQKRNIFLFGIKISDLTISSVIIFRHVFR